jgi:hypothetical protein
LTIKLKFERGSAYPKAFPALGVILISDDALWGRKTTSPLTGHDVERASRKCHLEHSGMQAAGIFIYPFGGCEGARWQSVSFSNDFMLNRCLSNSRHRYASNTFI